MVGLSHSLGVQTVAEGVETEHDAQVLRGLGCGMAQGYLFGRPVPAERLVSALPVEAREPAEPEAAPAA